VIVTVTLNPALQVEYEAEQVLAGESNQVSRVRYRPAGRGLSVARILHTFGHEVAAAGLAGGSAGELIRTELARVGVATQFTPIAAETRRVLMISDAASGATTSFAEPAPFITTEELGRLASDYRDLLVGATAVVLCGSLPNGLPAEIYGSFASYAAEAGVPVILDAGGSALAFGAERKPALVIPELAPGDDAADLRPAPGSSPVAVLTGQAVRVLTPDREWLAKAAPAGSTGEAVRDALVAGFVPGIALAWSWPDTLRHAVALRAAWTSDGQLDVETYEATLTATDVQQLPRGHIA
jgi:tagatose 6-phosphate kinase